MAIKRESFSEINRVTGNARLKELHGILKGKVGEELEKNIFEFRDLHRKIHKKKTERTIRTSSF
ncbi:MAG: hypothetical protein Q7S74_04625 [Nanoarchaeota archaeon]|nr:hypothetical protein [Nanoarchaeota archaeon]